MKQNGFNLIGMIMTIGVILLLFMSIYVAVDPVSRINTAKDKAREQDVLLLAQALKDYALDNKGQLPISGDITTSKKVLCSGSVTLTCGTDTKTCLTIDDTTNFLDDYLATLPVDPEKTDSADTGYYIQGSGDQIIIGSCNYENSEVTYNPRIKATIVTEVICGNGVLEGAEVCDSNLSDPCSQNSDYYKDGYVGTGSCVPSGSYDGCNDTCDACISGTSCQRSGGVAPLF